MSTQKKSPVQKPNAVRINRRELLVVASQKGIAQVVVMRRADGFRPLSVNIAAAALAELQRAADAQNLTIEAFAAVALAEALVARGVGLVWEASK